MKITHDDIYKVLAGSLHINPKDFNPNTNLVNGYKFDSLSIFEIPLILEEHFGVHVDVPSDILSEVSTGKDLADYIVQRVNNE
jgi:acyl carrier protein